MKVAMLITDPIGQALKQNISLLYDVEFVNNAYDAHVVVAENAKEMAPYYCKEREFILFSRSPRNEQEARNVHEYGILQSMEVMTFPEIRAQKGFSENLPGPTIPENRRIVKIGAKRVLVIDDTPKHQRSALILLSDYDLTVATGYDEAIELLGKERFDVVLTDMEMPMSMKLSTYILGKLISYGLLIEKEAVLYGIKYVAIVTRLDHHTDPFAAAFDRFDGHEFTENETKVKYINAPMIEMDGDLVKDWRTALNNLLS